MVPIMNRRILLEIAFRAIRLYDTGTLVYLCSTRDDTLEAMWDLEDIATPR